MKRIFLILISIICLFSAFGKKNTTSNKTNVPFYVNPGIESYGTDPGASPEVISQRLEALGSEIDLRYNAEVQKYIDVYMKNGRRQVTTFQILAAYYLPIFEKAIADAGLPDELKYIPFIESGLDAKATSYAGAGGLWQIMPSVARGYDMKVNGTIDERRDPYIASQRACIMLKKAYEKFGDWGLALASYNCGSGTLGKALKRAGGECNDFWSVYNYLPAQTRHYVPKFIAMVYVMNYYAEHNIPEVKVAQYAADTIRISEKMSIKNLSSMFGVSVADLKALNPHFSTDAIPGTVSRPCNVILPLGAVLAYREYRDLPDFMKNDESSRLLIASANAAPVAVSAANKGSEKRHNPNADNYYDEESSTFPGTYIRKVKTPQSANAVRRGETGRGAGMPDEDPDDTFSFIQSIL